MRPGHKGLTRRMTDWVGLATAAFLAICAIGVLVVVVALVVACLQLLTVLAKKRLSPKKQSDAPSTEHFKILGRMTRMARPTLLMTPAKQPGFSKLGGEPGLPRGMAWPAGEKASRAFLAQVDLAEVRAAEGPDWLPADGRLYTFYDDQRPGFADLVQIVHSREPAGENAPCPADVSPKLRFPERRVEFLRLRSIPSLDWLGVDVRDLDDDVDLDELADLPNEAFGDELQHRIGGYPSEIQDEQMALSCERLRRGLDPYDGEEPTPALLRASKAWRLLLQIDSDPMLKMNWGDGGMLYVFIREHDARAGDFSKTVTLFQCY